jgi:hypothetical protein
MPLAWLLGVAMLQPAPIDLYSFGPYRPEVPRVESILGFQAGERNSTFREQEMVLSAIAARAADRVRTIQYGKSVEGRPLRIHIISSPANIARLEQIRLANLALGEGKGNPSGVPAIVWINQCIHGNEPASFESAMWLMYNLAASRGQRVTSMLDRTVVILNPVYNPDGHERFAVYSNSVSVGSPDPSAFEQPEPGVIHGRTNHYRFDMNRDRVAMSQDETRQEVREFLRWKPHVYVDQHGQTDNYFFPPNPMAINGNVDRDRLNKWADVFGRATAKEFDERGWTYFIKDIFDFFYPGYLDSWATLSGAIGMTHETDGGKQLAKLRADGTVLTLRDGLEKHLVSALAVIEASAKRRDDLVSSFAQFKKRAVTGESAGKFQRVVLVSEDPRPLIRLKEHLDRMGVTSAFAADAFKQPDANDYWSNSKGEQSFPAGSLVIDIAQPQGALAKAMLEPKPEFEEEFLKAQRGKKNTAPKGEDYPGPDGHEFYDWTGWAFPYSYNLKAWWCESRPAIKVSDQAPAFAKGLAAESPVGYALRNRDMSDILAAFDVLSKDIRGMVTVKPMVVGGDRFDRGTFIFLAARNQPGFGRSLAEIGRRRGAQFVPLKTSYPDEGRWGPGSENTIALRKPEIAVVFGNPASPSAYGPMWYLMERVFKLPFTPITTQALTRDLSKYSVIVTPSGSGATASGKLREFVTGGGCVIALDSIGWALGSSGFVDLKTVEGEVDSLPGSLFRAKVDTRSFLSYSLPGNESGSVEIAVPIEGGTHYRVREEGGSMITLSNEEKVTKLLSGWEFADTEKHLRGTVWSQQVPVGGGYVVLFPQDPAQRAMWPGLWSILLNGMLIGPR